MLSAEVADRVENADIDYMTARITALAALPGNPHGAHVRRLGDATALLVAADPNPFYNNVMGMTARSVEHLADLGEWYAGHGVILRVDVTPQAGDDALYASLRAAGLSHVGFFGALYATPDAVASCAVGIAGEVTIESAEIDEFASVYVEGLAYPSAHAATMTASVLVLSSVPDVHLFRARAGGRTIGVGLLHVCAGTAYLAAASTLIDARGRGAQLALIRHRVEVAAELGCDLAVGHAAFGSSSQRNLERAGLRMAYTKALWARP